MTDELKLQIQSHEKIMDFSRQNFPEEHKLITGFYEAQKGSIMDFTAEFTTYVRYDESMDKVIITGGTRGCIPRPVEPSGEHVNLFYAPLNEQQQDELSDLLDDVTLLYENNFADQVSDPDDQDNLMYEFKRLYEFLKEWEGRACDTMPQGDL